MCIDVHILSDALKISPLFCHQGHSLLTFLFVTANTGLVFGRSCLHIDLRMACYPCCEVISVECWVCVCEMGVLTQSFCFR